MPWWQQLHSYISVLNCIAIKFNDDDLVICTFFLHDNSNLKTELSFLNHLEHDVDAAIWDLDHKKLIKTESVVLIVCVHNDDTILDATCFHFFIVWVVGIFVNLFTCVVFEVFCQHFWICCEFSFDLVREIWLWDIKVNFKCELCTWAMNTRYEHEIECEKQTWDMNTRFKYEIEHEKQTWELNVMCDLQYEVWMCTFNRCLNVSSEWNS